LCTHLGCIPIPYLGSYNVLYNHLLLLDRAGFAFAMVQYMINLVELDKVLPLKIYHTLTTHFTTK